MNVLLTSVGRRTYLVEFFREALQGSGKVLATNTTMSASGMMLADGAFVVPPPTDPAYISEILDICVRHNIRAVFSLHDWEAPFLSAHADQFRERGIQLAVSKPEVIQLCLDKYETYQFALKNELAVPKTTVNLSGAKQSLLDGSLRFPLIVKPRCGQGSIGLEMVEEEWELEACHRRGIQTCIKMSSNGLLPQDGQEAMLIQERVAGVEYGLDVVNDFNGRFACCLVKRKLEMRAGETDSAETVRDESLEIYGRKLGELLGHIGVLDVDIIVSDGVPYLIEMNPRFGGHYPFSHAAGANIPAAMIAWLSGRLPQEAWLRVEPGVRCFKGVSLIRDTTSERFKSSEPNPGVLQS
jgi:carbamoyl-phosphate synthase large subunit